jgi:hypothetical protein
MGQLSHEFEPRCCDEPPPLERELAGLPELDRFASDGDRASTLRAVHRRIEDPYTLAYWAWVTVMVCVAIAAARSVGWGLKAIGTPPRFPAVVGIIVGIGVYMGLYRLLIRWAARPELRRELAAQGQEGPSARQAKG